MDIRTLLFVAIVAYAVTGVMMLVYARRHRTMPGFRTFALSALAAGAALVAFGLRGPSGPLPVAASVVLSNLFDALACVLRVDAFINFEQGRRLSRALRMAIPPVFVFLQLVFFIVRDDLAVRSVFVSLLGVAAFSASAAALFRSPRPRDGVRLAMAWSNVLLAAVLGVRAVLWIAGESQDLFHLDSALAVYLFLLVAYETAQAIGLVMLNGERVEAELEASTTDLTAARADLGVLQGLLPICASCKSIRDPEGVWSPIEKYVHEHTEARFSHGLCPQCVARLYPDYAAEVLAGSGSRDGG